MCSGQIVHTHTRLGAGQEGREGYHQGRVVPSLRSSYNSPDICVFPMYYPGQVRNHPLGPVWVVWTITRPPNRVLVMVSGSCSSGECRARGMRGLGGSLPPVISEHYKMRHRLPKVDLDTNPFCLERQINDQLEQVQRNRVSEREWWPVSPTCGVSGCCGCLLPPHRCYVCARTLAAPS